jgi:predicted kinase
MKKKDKHLIITVGLPKAGKSTWARIQGHPMVNPDSIRLALHGKKFFGPAEPMVWAIAYLMVDALFLAGHKTVIVDATAVSKRRRTPWVERFGKIADIEFKIFNTHPDECIRRALMDNEPDMVRVIKDMLEEWDLPREWDEAA